MMQVIARYAGDAVVLTLKGRLVLEDVEAELRAAIDGLIQQGRVKLVLNLQEVAYVDSAGLGFLVSKYVSLQRRGGDMALVGVSPRVAHVLEITRLSQVFETFASDDEAVQAVEMAHAHSRALPFTSTFG
jgi:anti-sigma B factor antagonist